MGQKRHREWGQTGGKGCEVGVTGLRSTSFQDSRRTESGRVYDKGERLSERRGRRGVDFITRGLERKIGEDTKRRIMNDVNVK